MRDLEKIDKSIPRNYPLNWADKHSINQYISRQKSNHYLAKDAYQALIRRMYEKYNNINQKYIAMTDKELDQWVDKIVALRQAVDKQKIRQEAN